MEYRRIAHAAKVLGVLKKEETRLAIAVDPLAHLVVIHAQLANDRVIAGPAVLCAVRINLIVLQVHKGRIARTSKGDLRSLPHVP